MLKQTLLASAMVTATFAFAAPKAAWIPSTTDVVLVGHNLQKDNKVADEAWRATLQTMGIEIESAENELLSLLNDNPAVSELYKAFEVDVKAKTHPFESATLAVRLPSSTASDAEDFSVILTMETTKTLNVDAIAKAINGLIDLEDTDRDEARFTQDGTWYTLKEEEGSISFGPYEKGLRFVASATATNDFDTLKNNTFKAIDSTNPLNKALVAPNTMASAKVVIKDLSALVKRYVSASDSDMQQIQAAVPMLFTTKALTWTLFSEGKNYIVDVTGDYATAADAQAAIDALNSYRFLATMGISADFPADSAVMKFVNDIAIKANDTSASLTITFNPDQVLKAFEEFQGVMAKSIMHGPQQPDYDFDDEEDFMDFDDEEEISEEEAEAILREMMQQK